MRRFVLSSIFLLIFTTAALAALQFPALTGRVVDDANVLSASTRQSLTQILADYEASSTNQVVVVTLPSLQGTSIEDYGYQLGRAWGIGQKGKDNGVLLIIAPKEHKVRIEVGYGLEGILTDAKSSEIIQGIILPDFRAGQIQQGIIAGTQAMISTLKGIKASVLNTQKENLSALPSTISKTHIDPGNLVAIIIIFSFFLIAFVQAFSRPLSASSGTNRYYYGRSGAGSFSGGGFGGGFSGGGGGFGGGGASGGW